MKNTISKIAYNHLIESKKSNKYANYITDTPCKLGSLKSFQVEGTSNIVQLKCCQVGGMFSGSHCYVLIS